MGRNGHLSLLSSPLSRGNRAVFSGSLRGSETPVRRNKILPEWDKISLGPMRILQSNAILESWGERLGQAFPIFLDFQCGLWSQSSQIFFVTLKFGCFSQILVIGWWPIGPILGILASFKLPALRHGLLLWQFGFWCHHLRGVVLLPLFGIPTDPK